MSFWQCILAFAMDIISFALKLYPPLPVKLEDMEFSPLL